MLKVTGVGAVSGALRVMSITVFAATEEDNQPINNTTVNRDELSLYTAALEHKCRYVEDRGAPGRLEQGLAALRNMAEPLSTWCQGAYGKVQPRFQGALEIGNESYAFLTNRPADFYPRAGVIGFAGVVGLFFARGSRIKKLVYPAGLVTVGASLYYPEAAVAFTKSVGDAVYDWALKSYVAIDKIAKTNSKPVAEKQLEQEKPEKSTAPASEC